MCNLKDVNRGVNRTILQISLLLLLNVFIFQKMYTADCADH